jgi:hypothetical protein
MSMCDAEIYGNLSVFSAITAEWLNAGEVNMEHTQGT